MGTKPFQAEAGRTNSKANSLRTVATTALEAEFPMEITSVTEESSLRGSDLKFRPSTSVLKKSSPYQESSRSPIWLAIAAGAAIAVLGVAVYAFFSLKPGTQGGFIASSIAPATSPVPASETQSNPKVAEPIHEPIKEPVKPVENTVASLAPVEDLNREAEKKKAREDEDNIRKRLEADRAKEKAEQFARTRSMIIESSMKQGAKFMESEQFSEASKEFEKVLELDPENAPAYQNLGISYVYGKRYNDAISAFEKYLNLAKDDQEKAYIQEMLATLKGQKEQGSDQ